MRTHTSGNILDLILCNREELVKEVRTEGRIGRSDHDLVAFKMCIATNRVNDSRPTWNFGKADFAVMRQKMGSIDWTEKLDNKTTNEMWISIRGCVRGLMDEHIPIRRGKRNKDPPWMDGEIRRCIAEKKKAWKKWKEKKYKEIERPSRIQEKGRGDQEKNKKEEK